MDLMDPNDNSATSYVRTVCSAVEAVKEWRTRGKVDYLPDIMYKLTPPTYFFRRPRQWMQPNGQAHTERLEFGFPPEFRLPEKLPAWLWELLTDRINVHLTVSQVHFLQVDAQGNPLPPLPTETVANSDDSMSRAQKFRRVINNRKARLRLSENIPTWVPDSTAGLNTTNVVECLLYEQIPTPSIMRDTVLDVRVVNGQKLLLKPSFDLSTAPAKNLASDYFLSRDFHGATKQVILIKETIADLQEKALKQRLQHWIFLKNKYKPQAWNTRLGANTREVRSGLSNPQKVNVKSHQDMPSRAREWIERRLRDSARDHFNRPDLPPMRLNKDRLSKSTRDWVEKQEVEGEKYPQVAAQGVYKMAWDQEISRAELFQYARYLQGTIARPQGNSDAAEARLVQPGNNIPIIPGWVPRRAYGNASGRGPVYPLSQRMYQDPDYDPADYESDEEEDDDDDDDGGDGDDDEDDYDHSGNYWGGPGGNSGGGDYGRGRFGGSSSAGPSGYGPSSRPVGGSGPSPSHTYQPRGGTSAGRPRQFDGAADTPTSSQASNSLHWRPSDNLLRNSEGMQSQTTSAPRTSVNAQRNGPTEIPRRLSSETKAATLDRTEGDTIYLTPAAKIPFDTIHLATSSQKMPPGYDSSTSAPNDARAALDAVRIRTQANKRKHSIGSDHTDSNQNTKVARTLPPVNSHQMLPTINGTSRVQIQAPTPHVGTRNMQSSPMDLMNLNSRQSRIAQEHRAASQRPPSSSRLSPWVPMTAASATSRYAHASFPNTPMPRQSMTPLDMSTIDARDLQGFEADPAHGHQEFSAQNGDGRPRPSPSQRNNAVEGFLPPGTKIVERPAPGIIAYETPDGHRFWISAKSPFEQEVASRREAHQPTQTAEPTDDIGAYTPPELDVTLPIPAPPIPKTDFNGFVDNSRNFIDPDTGYEMVPIRPLMDA